MNVGEDSHSSIGIYCSLSNNCEISGNNISSSNLNAGQNHYGIYLNTSDRNVSQGNNIDLVNNAAQDIGIYLDANSDNNQGGDNITYNVGTSISDNGAGNAVTAQDV